MKIIQDVTKGKLRSAYLEASFDDAKRDLEKKKYELISLEQMAQLRIQEGKDAYISQNGNWTREGFIYIPKEGIFLTKKSPVMASPEKATDCHKNKQAFCPAPKQVELALADSCKVTATSIPVLRLSEEELTVYAFGERAKAYGEFLNEAGIETFKVYTPNLQEKTFATQTWFGWLVGGSRLDGGDRDLCGGLFYYYKARGVQKA